MRVGPRRSPYEPLSAYRYRQAVYCWPWTWAIAPMLAAAVLILRMAHDRLWTGAAVATLLSGTALGLAALAGAVLSLAARWAMLCEHPAINHYRWRCASFAISTAVLVPAWLWSCYWTLLAMMRQHIVYGRWDNVVALSVEPQRFLLSLTVHAAMLVTIPVYWMTQASRQPLPAATAGEFLPSHHASTPADSPASRQHLRPSRSSNDR